MQKAAAATKATTIMKAMKQTKQTILQNPLDKLPPNLKKKGRKSVAEPMVLMTAATPASIAQYCIEIPSGTKNSALDEMDMLKNITVHLNQIVQTMEHVYTMEDKVKEEGEEEEEPLPHHREDMITFLIICTQLSNQVDAALHEEKVILESLLKWFEKEVQMMEELGEEKIIPDWQIPVADKNITDNINKLMNRIQRLEDLKGRVQELPKYMQVSTPREKRRQVGPPPALRDPKNIIQELALKHATEDVMNMVQVFQDDVGAPQTIESMNNRMVEIMKVFERQTNKLHRVTNEQGVVESKLQKIQHDFQKLAEEKEIMEDEFLKMKTSNITHKASTDTRKTLLAKLEKERAEGKGRAQQDRMRKPSKIKDPEAAKMKEDLTKAQANIQSLEKEKKMLEEKLQKVLEEANMARGKLAEIPPDIPDWEFPYTALEEKEKELSKRTRKGSKVKGKPSAEGTVQKTTRFDIAKAGEALPGKDYETSTAPQAKDGKPKKKGADLSDLERSSLHKIPSGVSEKQPKQYPDAKSGAKPKESADLRKRRSTLKGIGKELPTALPPLPPDQKKQQLPDSTDQQAKSVEISSKKQQEVLPALTSAVELQEQALPVIEPEPADLVSSRLTEPEEFVGESESLEKATAKPRTSLRTRTSLTGLQEDEIKELIDEGMLQLADHLTDLKGMLEAETLARLLLEPSKGLETLSDKQKLQLIRQLVAPDGQQQEQFLAPVEGQIVDEEQREKKRSALANIISTLNLLNQTQTEAGQSEEEANEMAKTRRLLLANLQSNITDLQQAQAVIPVQQELENKVNELTQKRSFLVSALESNLRDLKEAQAIAATQPSEMSKNKVKELLQERAALTACLATNQQKIQTAKAQEAVLAEKAKHEELNALSEKRRSLLAELEKTQKELQEAQILAATEPSSMAVKYNLDEKIKELTEKRKLLVANIESNLHHLEKARVSAGLAEESRLKQELNALSEKRRSLLAELEKTQNELQEAQVLAATEPSSMTDEKIKELTEKRKQLVANIESNLQDLERAQSSADLAEESRLKQEKINELSQKRKSLLSNLQSSFKDLQEAQALASVKPSAENDERIKELIEQRKLLTADLDTNLQDLERAQCYVPDLEEKSRLKQMELDEQTEKKKLLEEKLELNLKNLQQAQMLATEHPNSANEHKLHELIEEHQRLTAERAATVQVMQGLQREKKFNELSQKKQLLMKNLESNMQDLIEARALVAAEPGSFSEHKLQELIEQRKHLAADLDATVQHIEKLQLQDEVIKTPEMKLQELSDKKELLMRKLESTLKELQEAQALESSKPGSVSEQKLQELIEQRRELTAELESAVWNMQELQLMDEIVKSHEKEVHRLVEKKQHLLDDLFSTVKELQEAQAAVAVQPGRICEEKLQVIREKGKQLTADLEGIAHDIKKALYRASGRADLEPPDEQELHDLLEKKQLLLENLKANLKELEEVQALADSKPASLSDHEIQPLNEQRKLLNTCLDTIIQQIKETGYRCIPEMIKVSVISERDLYQLSRYKKLFLETLESNLKDLQDARTLAAIYPGSGFEQKVLEFAEQRRLLSTGLKAIMEDIEDVESQTPVKDAILKTREIILEELYQKQQLLLEKLEAYSVDLQEAEALAASHPDAENMDKIKTLTEQRRLLATGLEAIMEGIREAEGLDREKLERLERIEKELADLSENRQQLWRNVELNLGDLKDLQTLSFTEPESMQEERKQALSEKSRNLATNLEALLQDMAEAQSIGSSESSITSPSGININDLFEIKRLESKLNEVQQMMVLSSVWVDGIKRQLSELKAKRGFDRWDVSLRGPLSFSKEELALYGLDEKATRKLLGKEKWVSPYLQKSFKDLHQRSLKDLQQKSGILRDTSDKELYKPKEEDAYLAECLVSIPLKVSDIDATVKYGPDDEQLEKRRALVAKLEANMKELQAFYEAQEAEQVKEKPAPETLSEQLKKTKSPFPLLISKAPVMKKSVLQHEMIIPSIPKQGSGTLPFQPEQHKLQKKAMESELRRHIIQQLKKRLPHELVTRKHDRNLLQALAFPQSPLQQANLAAAQKLLFSQPVEPGIARFQDYSPQPPRQAWEGNRLPVTDYVQKLMALKKKLLSPDLKELLENIGAPQSTALSPTSSSEKQASMLIRGRAFSESERGRS
ncbi:putative leucine-rich repeat-containing protein DDB_G0290503 isoform X5 [Sphaerodactylus townsendi]|uniref:putative leucine-rich repeat-containing protein DDB_G0290503 isoform X5 n=1 Tax=Sphaerodactylus townsendi TaxID=933632 RepID=UPI0020271E2D|nr:putative leucine-rich repeat-containing protein DDB_G0290503 isoform X5 [Sphaerodactylus townsendi]